jgi:carbamoyltransferase
MRILGITFGHDSAACLIANGRIIADVAEERFSRVKHDSGFPAAAIAYCLKAGGISSEELDAVAIAGAYLPPGTERYFLLSEEQQAELSRTRPTESKVRNLVMSGGQSALPLYIGRFALSPSCRLSCVPHHLGHAAAAFFTRGRRDRCVIVTLDGIGDQISAAVWRGEANSITPLAQWGRTASLGWFYGTVTEALGWQHGDGEGTTMALATYGDAHRVGPQIDRFCPGFRDGELVAPHEFGPASFVSEHGNYHWHFHDAGPIRDIARTVGAEHVAARAQELIEQNVLEIVRHWLAAEGVRNLACSGGLFLNVKLNQQLWYGLDLDEHWTFPNPGDAGLAMGAALWLWHQMEQPAETAKLDHLYYGPEFCDAEIKSILDERGITYRTVRDPSRTGADLLAGGRSIGWFQGRMEAGPRALGNRSILMSPCAAEHAERLNARVKFREAFRPFCPSILDDRRDAYLQGGREEPFMITSFEVADDKRGRIPAVVHIDGTLRPQTVKRDINPRYYDLIRHFATLTGENAILNTSFNVKGEPIACHPRDALRCFFDTGLDALLLGSFLLEKAQAAS